jgi:hypothetical protein
MGVVAFVPAVADLPLFVPLCFARFPLYSP